MPIEKLFGQRLTKIRKIRGFTQERLGLETEISTVHLRNLEHGRGNPSLKTIHKLSCCLNIPIGWLIGELPDFDVQL